MRGLRRKRTSEIVARSQRKGRGKGPRRENATKEKDEREKGRRGKEEREGRRSTTDERKRKEHLISGRERFFAAFCRDFEKGVRLTVFFEIGDGARRGRGRIGRWIPSVECLPKAVWFRVLDDFNDGKTFEVLKVFDSATIFETPFKEKGSAISAAPQIECRGGGKDEGTSLVEEGGSRGTSSGLWRDLFEDNSVW